MTEIIMRLRKCAEDLSQIADALARQTSTASTVDLPPVSFGETTVPEISRLDALRIRPDIPVVVGRNIDRASVSFDLATVPHLLVGGAAGQGKSMFIHCLINGLISTRSPEEVRLMLFDPKHAEFLAYTNLPHLVVPVMNENRRLVFALH